MEQRQQQGQHYNQSREVLGFKVQTQITKEIGCKDYFVG